MTVPVGSVRSAGHLLKQAFSGSTNPRWNTRRGDWPQVVATLPEEAAVAVTKREGEGLTSPERFSKIERFPKTRMRWQGEWHFRFFEN